MNAQIDAERILDAFLAPEADRLPDRVLDAALADIARTPQRRAFRVPWRFTLMPAYFKLATAAAVIVLVSVGTLSYLGRGPGTGGPQPPPTPSAAPTASPAPTFSITTVPPVPPLTQTFESAVHGFSIAYPADWSTEQATSARSPVQWEGDTGSADIFDYLRAPGAIDSDDLPGAASYVLRATSVLAPEEAALDDWITEYLTGSGAPCFPETLPEITIDGYTGTLRDTCDEVEATVLADDRIYVFTLFVNARVPNGQEMFEALAETIDLRPLDRQASTAPG